MAHCDEFFKKIPPPIGCSPTSRRASKAISLKHRKNRTPVAHRELLVRMHIVECECLSWPDGFPQWWPRNLACESSPASFSIVTQPYRWQWRCLLNVQPNSRDHTLKPNAFASQIPEVMRLVFLLLEILSCSESDDRAVIRILFQCRIFCQSRIPRLRVPG